MGSQAGSVGKKGGFSGRVVPGGLRPPPQKAMEAASSSTLAESCRENRPRVARSELQPEHLSTQTLRVVKGCELICMNQFSMCGSQSQPTRAIKVQSWLRELRKESMWTNGDLPRSGSEEETGAQLNGVI